MTRKTWIFLAVTAAVAFFVAPVLITATVSGASIADVSAALGIGLLAFAPVLIIVVAVAVGVWLLLRHHQREQQSAPPPGAWRDEYGQWHNVPTYESYDSYREW